MTTTAPDAGRVDAIAGAAAAAALIAHTYRVEYLDAAAHRAGHFAASTRLARSVAVRRLARCRDLAQVAATVAVVLAESESKKPEVVE